MADRRMFSKNIIDSDAFLDMPLEAQALYFHLAMRADDDGFVNNPKKIIRMISSSEDSFKILVLKGFILPFESGIIVIKHWRIHNYIQKDRYKETVYQEERSLLSVKDNGAYTLDTECIQDGYSLDTQVRLGKESIGKDSLGEDRKGNKRFAPPSVTEVADYVAEKGYHIDPEAFVDFYQSKGWKVGKESMKDWKAAVRTWEKREKPEKNNEDFWANV
jgi:hypothetical protein